MRERCEDVDVTVDLGDACFHDDDGTTLVELELEHPGGIKGGKVPPIRHLGFRAPFRFIGVVCHKSEGDISRHRTCVVVHLILGGVDVKLAGLKRHTFLTIQEHFPICEWFVGNATVEDGIVASRVRCFVRNRLHTRLGDCVRIRKRPDGVHLVGVGHLRSRYRRANEYRVTVHLPRDGFHHRHTVHGVDQCSGLSVNRRELHRAYRRDAVGGERNEGNGVECRTGRLIQKPVE